MNRDLTIDEKMQMLSSKKDEYTNIINSIPNPITNLRISSRNSNDFSFRACSTLNEIYDGFKKIEAESSAIKSFNSLISDTGEQLDYIIFGYPYSAWQEDIKNIAKKLIYNQKFNAVNKAITNLEKFYSGDRKEEIAFNSLINDIENL